MKVGDLVIWNGKKRFCEVKTNSLGVIINVYPFRYVALDYDVQFSNSKILTCHKDDLRIVK
jgi:hypothetical protein